MKKYIILLLLAILISSCTTQTQTEEPTPVTPPIEEPETPPIEEPPVEEPQETVTQEPQIEPQKENTIEIKESSFDPVEKIIGKNTEIEWINKDKKEHKIACYLSGTRVTTSSNLNEEDSFTYTFLQEGQYTCIDAIYGLRSTITVKTEQSLLSPTGNIALEGGTKSIKGASLAAMALIALMLLLFFSYGKKRR